MTVKESSDWKWKESLSGRVEVEEKKKGGIDEEKTLLRWRPPDCAFENGNFFLV